VVVLARGVVRFGVSVAVTLGEYAVLVLTITVIGLALQL
jgi:hypothetical protein